MNEEQGNASTNQDTSINSSDASKLQIERVEDSGPINTLSKVNPAKAERILARLAAGASYRSIIKDEHTDYNTIVNVREANPVKFEEWRKIAANKASIAAELAIDQIIHRLSDDEQEDLKTLAVTYGILTDKNLTFNEQPTSIIETRSGISVDDARTAILAAQKRIQAEAIDV